MPPDLIQELLDSARHSGLLSAEQAATWHGKLAGAGTMREVATRLVEHDVLTEFQVEQLLAGRGRECVLAGRYVLQRKLGAGAMGSVYLAHDQKLDRAVAIKLLSTASVPDAGAIARFQREAKALAKLSHPNIIQAHDSEEDAGRHFLVMEYAEGTNLAELIRAKGRIAPALAAEFAHQAAIGLQRAHECGIVHRDLKPGNLLLTASGQLKILDLGLARFLQDQISDTTLTREGTGMGTPDYMAPEQFHDARHVDARSDVYSLGCTLYHMLAGAVPYPGTSLSEKYEAHEQKEPVPLAVHCPDVPAGLALTVERMMAKRPADRFQTAREVAEALFPHIAGSSQLAANIKATITWHGSQLGMSVVPIAVRRRRRVLHWAGGITAVVMVLVLTFVAGGFLNEPARTATNNGESAESTDKSDQRVESLDPNLLTVAKDGLGQYSTLSEAVAKVDRPGMTIRVIDSGTYDESIELRDPDRQSGLTIEATRRATVSVPTDARFAFLIRNVPNVTIQGFSIQVMRPQTVGAGATGQCKGLEFDDLDFRGSQNRTTGISIDAASVREGEKPMVIQNCKFTGVSNGIEIISIGTPPQSTDPVQGLIVQNNLFSENLVGVWIWGRVNRVFVVANRIQHFTNAGIRISNHLAGSQQLLLANNTVRGPSNCLEFQAVTEAIEGVEIRNNVVSAESGMDIVHPQTEQSMIQPWNIRQNARRFRARGDGDPAMAHWVKPNDDLQLENLEWKSTDIAQEDFLVPKDESKLATGGAAGDLPGYLGAIPPNGTKAWDWRKLTWDKRYPKMLLTVSQDPKAGGDFRTINEALAMVTRPGMTIRVLDDAEYAGAIMITQSGNHEGLTIESPSRATIAASAGMGGRVVFGIFIRSVPRVTLRGFRLVQRGHPDKAGMLIMVMGNCPGVTIEDMDVGVVQNLTNGFHLENVTVLPGESPVEIRNCVLSKLNMGVVLLGMNVQTGDAFPVNGIVIRNNRIHACSGEAIAISGRVSNVAIVENRIGDCGISCVSIGDILAGSRGILLANNTIRTSQDCFRIFSPIDRQSDVRIASNFILSVNGPDLQSLGIDLTDFANWKISNNYRQHQPPESADGTRRYLPFAKDRIGGILQPLSIDPTDAEYLTFNESIDIPTIEPLDGLPNYIGPIAPRGSNSWVWDWSKVLSNPPPLETGAASTRSEK
jgi:hypothetical protein